MRLVRREEVDETAQDSEEYRNAIRSVIQCQIKSLLQKLALETGDETIVISTSVTRGTFCHFGSYIGNEFLEERDQAAQTVGVEFNEFCAEKQSCGFIRLGHDTQEYLSTSQGETQADISRKSLHAPRKKTPRKRPLVPVNQSPPNKRKATNQYYFGTGSSHLLYSSSQNDDENVEASLLKGDDYNLQKKGDNAEPFASFLKQGNSSQDKKSSHVSESRNDENIVLTSIPWIKAEPVDDYQDLVNGGNSPASNISQEMEIENDKHGVTNRPKSLIPLANILKKYGTKSTRSETMGQMTDPVYCKTKGSDENASTDRSILRSLYEEPVVGLDDTGARNSEAEKGDKVAISLPRNLGDTLEQFPSSENLVLSGYYDSENYPANRHSKRHLTNPSKKSRSKEKSVASMSTNLAKTPDSSPSVSFVESLVTPPGSDLKMRMFESNGRLVYACDVCKRELSHLTSYRRHMKLHTMDRPHKCPVCSKGFIRKYHCIDHINKHHKGVDFDSDTLLIKGCSRSLEDATTPSDSLSVSPGEYNYTLDQSLDDSDQSGCMNTSIDQSASTMLSELARSAQKAQLDKPESETVNQSAAGLLNQFEGIKGTPKELKITINLTEKTTSLKLNEPHDKDENGAESEDKVSTNGENEKNEDATEKSETAEDKPENSAMARKWEVTEGIKAIVAHLKSSSRKKKMREENEQISLEENMVDADN